MTEFMHVMNKLAQYSSDMEIIQNKQKLKHSDF